jgi:hypothetical protein
MKVTFWKRYGADAGDTEEVARQVDEAHSIETTRWTNFSLMG